MASKHLLNIRGNEHDGYSAEIMAENGDIIFTTVGAYDTAEIAKEQTVSVIHSIMRVLSDSNNSIESMFNEPQ